MVRTSILALALLVAGCANSPIKLVGGPQSLKTLSPWYQQSLSVADVTQDGDFLLADFEGGTEGGTTSMRAYFAANAACRAALTKGAAVTYSGGDRFGSVDGPQGVCHSVGTRDLVSFRDAQYSTDPMARAQGANAVFKKVRDQGEIWLRGQFPYASELGFMADDLIMIVPKSQVCEQASAQGTALMYYYDSGSRVFMLVANAARCPVVGVIDPS